MAAPSNFFGKIFTPSAKLKCRPSLEVSIAPRKPTQRAKCWTYSVEPVIPVLKTDLRISSRTGRKAIKARAITPTQSSSLWRGLKKAAAALLVATVTLTVGFKQCRDVGINALGDRLANEFWVGFHDLGAPFCDRIFGNFIHG